MKPIVELISEWDSYTKDHQEASVEEFCHYFLSKKKIQNEEQLFEGMLPPDTDSSLAKLIGRLSGMHQYYSKMAFKTLSGIDLEWFYFLNAINLKKEARKIDIINFSLLFEPSTGIDILRRMKEEGLITEKDNPADKRAKLVSLLPKGKDLLMKLGALMYKATYQLYHAIPESDKELIIRLLSETEIKHGKILTDSRNKSIDELIEKEYSAELVESLPDLFIESMKRYGTKSRPGQV